MTGQYPSEGIAKKLASHGRFGDTELLHVNKIELDMLEAASPGGLTINPHTGQKEAFLPLLIPLLAPLLGGALGTMGAGALGLGAMGTLGLGALGSGLATGLATGSAREGVKSGLLSFGLGGLGNLMKGGQAAAGAYGANAASKITPAVALNPTPASMAAKTAALTAKFSEAAPVIAPSVASAAPASMMSRLAGSGMGGGISAAMQDPRLALSTLIKNPLQTALPIGAALMVGSDAPKVSTVRTGSGSEGPKDRPEGGYGAAPRTINPYTGDYTTYGERPNDEHLWFNYGQQGGVPSGGVMPNDLQQAINSGQLPPDVFAGGGVLDVTGGFSRRGYSPQLHADGGGITGPGGPRDDKVPALLSNGEYVLSAKAVKNIGSGSTEAGFDRLDKLHSKAKRKKFAEGGGVYENPEELGMTAPVVHITRAAGVPAPVEAPAPQPKREAVPAPAKRDTAPVLDFDRNLVQLLAASAPIKAPDGLITDGNRPRLRPTSIGATPGIRYTDVKKQRAKEKEDRAWIRDLLQRVEPVFHRTVKT